MDEVFIGSFISFLAVAVTILSFLINHERRLTRIEDKLDMILRYMGINNDEEEGD